MTTPLVYIMFKIGMENKQYGTSFEITTYSQTKLQFQNFFYVSFFFFSFLHFLKKKIILFFI